MSKMLLAMALVAAPAAAAAPSPLVSAIEVCRTAFVERMAGSEPVKATAALAALPDEQRALTAFICAGYEQGQLDLLRMIAADADTGAAPI
ncbi:MAG TPA: hypothetical protein VGW34_14910 [Allosphingosinicella sp.]|nr:hypothetical protein [Allosphingosinicella sp.]